MSKNNINFYQVDDDIIKAMAPILLKVIEEKKRAFIYVKDSAQVEKIDAGLWSYGRSKFIPHAMIFDKDFVLAKQPIIISNNCENINQADYLIFLDEPETSFIAQFTRIFYFYTQLPKCQNIKPDNIYKKVDGKWHKVLL